MKRATSSRAVAPPDPEREMSEALDAEEERLCRACAAARGEPVRVFVSDALLDRLYGNRWPIKIVGRRKWSSRLSTILTPIEVARAPERAGKGTP